jgi:hypothetical protein
MFSETRLALLLSGCLLAGNTLASSLEDGVVYSKTDTFNNEISLTDDFRIGESGRYEATLKDLENTRPFTQSSLEVSSGSDSLGSRSGPGAFTFEAEPGDFAVSLFASVSVSDEEKQRMIYDTRKALGEAWWQSLSPEQKKEQKEKSIWSTGTDEQQQAYRERIDKGITRRVEEQLAGMSQGEYDIQINAVSAVPVPAAVWLFVSGVLGLAGIARKKPGQPMS